MNKTVTINISGIIFHIEEDAYEKLSKYLLTIRGYFSNADGGSEIMSDIEARIAEMLQSKTSAVKQVVLMADVDYVMESMGKPEDFAGDTTDADNAANVNETFNTSSAPKRLYRDTDNKVFGGVCSGVGHYFGFDPVWLRIALACLFFFAGTGFLLYLILWIAIPEAKTTAEKLAMKGEKADINNISKTVKEEAEQLKKRMQKYGKEFENMSASGAPRNGVERVVDFIGDVLLNIGRVLLKIIGIFLVIFGVIIFFGLFTTVFGVSIVHSNLEVREWIDLFLMDGQDYYLGLIGLILFIIVPVIILINFGLKVLFKVRFLTRWFKLGAGIIWLIGFSLVFCVIIKTANDFNKTSKIRETIQVVPSDTLNLKVNAIKVDHDELSNSEDVQEGEDGFVIGRRHNDYILGKHLDQRYLLGHAKLNIIKSQTDRTEIVIVKEASGSDKQIARLRAQHIDYHVNQQNNEVLFDDLFKVNNADKWREQEVTVILKLPVNKVVYLDKSLANLIYDIENVTNTYDGDMINRRWMMTEAGLKCIDCEGLISVEDHVNDNDNDDEDKHVKINVNGVDINAKDAQIKMDSNGVDIKSKDTKVIIDKNGIHVDQKPHKK